MTLSLTPEMQRFIDERVRAGRYASPEDVIRAGLASLSQQEAVERLSSNELEAAFPGLRQKIEQGLREARAGRLYDGEEFFDELEREFSKEEPDRKSA